jgi:asparagine synthetase B (glutamine-hydrolysing)
MANDLPNRVERVADALFQEMEGETVFLEMGSGEYYGIDDVGTRMWRALEETATVEAAGLSDAVLILFAYQKWGEGLSVHPVGAFAFALWDERHRRLLLARDALGHCVLFYSIDNGTVAFASEAKAILAVRSTPAPDLLTIARMASPEARRRDTGATFFEGIRALPAATSMVLDEQGSRLTSYWQPDVGASLDFRRDHEVLDALR